MMTNTYLPHVGGVARSVDSFSQALRSHGHEVMVIAPEFPEMPEHETDVIRVPAIQRFNGSDFSVRLPLPGLLADPLDLFKPNLIHAHHPFLLGDTALREASSRGLPLVFTHHTLYEEYTHYLTAGPENGKGSHALKRFVIDLSTGFANLCDQVIAPSQSIADLLLHRGVTTPIKVIPTGVDLKKFTRASGSRFRRDRGIPLDAFVVGHTGRLAPEKNLMFLTQAVAEFLKARPKAWFVVAGSGPLEIEMREHLESQGLSDRVCFAGILQGRELKDGYACMDVFAFASQSETQGMVLAEAMAAGVPVVAVDANGVREVVKNGINGYKLDRENEAAFIGLLNRVAEQDAETKAALILGAKQTARKLSMAETVKKLVRVYTSVIDKKGTWELPEDTLWNSAMRRLHAEWNILGTLAHAVSRAMSNEEAKEDAKEQALESESA